ncbi:MAG: hypothetical protein EBV06_09485 [Planctomycetia bacterium]|nr:hypothetical protein [Planctomycetia bacterium]
MILRVLAFAGMLLPLAVGAGSPNQKGATAPLRGRVEEFADSNEAKDEPAGRVFEDRQWSGVIPSVPVLIKKTMIGRMSITNFTPKPTPHGVLPAPAPATPKAPAGKAGAPVAAPPKLPLLKSEPPVEEVLCVCRWQSGRFLEDSHGRRWILVYGGADWSHPEHLAGWMLPSTAEAPHFFSRNGRLYRLQYAP